MGSGGKGKPTKVILDGIVNEYVGIGWIELEKAKPAEYRNYPVVVD